LAIPVPKVDTSVASTVTKASELTVAQSDSRVINPNPIAVNILFIFTKIKQIKYGALKKRA
jgi:hypothetical protein